MRARGGFTLIEVVVVLLILAVATAVTVPAFRGDPVEDDITAAVRTLDNLFGLARDSAIRSGRDVTVVIDSTTSHVWLVTDATAAITVGDTIGLPAGVRLQLTKSRASFAFAPDGATYADSVRVLVGAADRLLTLDPWTGRLVVEQ